MGLFEFYEEQKFSQEFIYSGKKPAENVWSRYDRLESVGN